MLATRSLQYSGRHARRKRIVAGGVISGLLALLGVFLLFCIWMVFGDELFDSKAGISGTRLVNVGQYPATTEEELPWNLVLVNKWHSMPDEGDPELTLLSNGRKVDSRIYPELQRMFDDARAEGIFPIVREGFRTHEQQIQIFDDKVSAYMNEGYGRSEAEKMAEQWVAIPGYSEHELGLAVDINADKERSDSDEVYFWLAQNAWKYGFILRYPQGKEDITGIDFEPWHYRYVGYEAAKTIYEKGITLEEYLEDFR